MKASRSLSQDQRLPHQRRTPDSIHAFIEVWPEDRLAEMGTAQTCVRSAKNSVLK
jgi:hypothetical protein